MIGKVLIGWFIGQSEPGSAFGAAGALAVILVFVYYASMIVLLGVSSHRCGPAAKAIAFDRRSTP